MKKTLLGILALLSFATAAQADGLVVANAGIQAGKTATVQVALSNTSGESYRAVLFSLTLPTGITMVKDEFGEPVTTAEAAIAASGYGVTANELTDGSFRFAVVSTSGDEAIPAECGPLFSFSILADAGLTVGNLLNATLSDIKLTDAWAVDHEADNVQFSITIEEARTILDETSATMPEAATGVNVRVKRAIKANVWNTICLPFSMTETLVKAAFGDDVQLGDFTSWSSEEDDGGAIIGINVGFTAVSEMEANHPYIIKTSTDINEFTIDGVDIDPEDEPKVQVGKKSSERGYMYGTYTKKNVPEENLFLSGGKFWYSMGATTMKAFRGYFEFRDVLDTYYDQAAARITMTFGDSTGISQVNGNKSDDQAYNLQGQRVEHARHGLYIRDGKKFVAQ